MNSSSTVVTPAVSRTASPLRTLRATEQMSRSVGFPRDVGAGRARGSGCTFASARSETSPGRGCTRARRSPPWWRAGVGKISATTTSAACPAHSRPNRRAARGGEAGSPVRPHSAPAPGGTLADGSDEWSRQTYAQKTTLTGQTASGTHTWQCRDTAGQRGGAQWRRARCTDAHKTSASAATSPAHGGRASGCAALQRTRTPNRPGTTRPRTRPSSCPWGVPTRWACPPCRARAS